MHLHLLPLYNQYSYPQEYVIEAYDSRLDKQRFSLTTLPVEHLDAASSFYESNLHPGESKTSFNENRDTTAFLFNCLQGEEDCFLWQILIQTS